MYFQGQEQCGFPVGATGNTGGNYQAEPYQAEKKTREGSEKINEERVDNYYPEYPGHYHTDSYVPVRCIWIRMDTVS
jgi:hypothetical protein